MVRTGDESHHGISCLLIEKDTPGLSFGKLEKKMGWRNQPPVWFILKIVDVPVANRVGDEGWDLKLL